MTKALATWFVIATAAASPAVTAPADVVQSAVTRVVRVLETMRQNGPQAAAPTRATADRARLEIRRVAAELFDVDEVARRSLSRHWSHRTRAEQAEFVALFADLLERAYVSKIEAYAWERIVYAGESVDGDYATVKSRVVTARGEVALDYRLHLAGERWKVYDLVVDGVSLVSTYRNEFNRIIQSASYEELVDRLRRKTLALRPAAD
jgi:phospholipid transport system substrate-binding protein